MQEGLWHIQGIEKLKSLKDKNGMEYNEIRTAPAPSNQVMDMIWNDNAPVLFMANYNDGSGTITTLRKRPGVTSTNTKVARAFFGDQGQKEVKEPIALWLYNHNILYVD
jgi:hypothetical protein